MKKLLFICCIFLCNIKIIAGHYPPIFLKPIDEKINHQEWIIQNDAILDTIEVRIQVSLKFDTTSFPKERASFEISYFKIVKVRSKLIKLPDDEVLKKIICDKLENAYYLNLDFKSIDDFKKSYNLDFASFFIRFVLIPKDS